MTENSIFRKYEQPLKGGVLLPHLIKIRGHKCESCKNCQWLGKPINLQVHHIDGDKTNNVLSNLQLLCLNCHSMTDNFGSKNIKRNAKITDEDFITALKNHSSIRQALLSLGLSDASGNYDRAKKLMQENNIQIFTPIKIQYKCFKCGKEIHQQSTYCKDCFNLEQRIVKDRPAREELKYLIRNFPFTHIGKKYGVSDNAVRKWCLSDRLPTTKKDINSYSKEEWELI